MIIMVCGRRQRQKQKPAASGTRGAKEPFTPRRSPPPKPRCKAEGVSTSQNVIFLETDGRPPGAADVATGDGEMNAIYAVTKCSGTQPRARLDKAAAVQPGGQDRSGATPPEPGST